MNQCETCGGDFNDMGVCDDCGMWETPDEEIGDCEGCGKHGILINGYCSWCIYWPAEEDPT